MVKVEGFWGLWRGNLANIIRVVPNKGVLLMCSDMYKATIAAALPGCGGATISSIAGGLAGLTAVLLTYPLELVRTRMAYRLCDDPSCSPYGSVWYGGAHTYTHARLGSTHTRAAGRIDEARARSVVAGRRCARWWRPRDRLGCTRASV